MASILPLAVITGGSLFSLLFIPLSIVMIFANIYIYVKYYKKDDMGLFNENIGSLLKKTMISVLIVMISFLPLVYTFMIIGSGGYYSMMMIALISIFVGMIMSWIYYLYNLIKLYKNLDPDFFAMNTMDNLVKLNEIEILKNMYSKYIVLTIIAPFIMYFSSPLLIVYVISANLYMFLKYYHKTEDNLIHNNFKKILKVTVIASIVVAISIIFKISYTLELLDNYSKVVSSLRNHDKYTSIPTNNYKISEYGLYAAFFIGWVSCLYVLITNFKINAKKTKQLKETELLTDNKGDINV